ncbi:hypothetical protein BH11ACT5_BH11ACT5_10890 [soil metagenome]
MTWIFGVLATSLGIYLLWGLLAPRSQWRALAAWSVSNPHAHEPGGSAYGWRRLLSGLGVLGLAVVGIFAATPGLLAALPDEERVDSPVTIMWGSPDPQMVNRAVYGSSAPPARLVEFPVLGYQDLDELDELPPYLLDLKEYALLGNTSPSGYIGSAPAVGFSGIGTADLVVNVRGPVLCIPREAVVIETDTAVQIAIYYGLPNPKASKNPAKPTPVPDHEKGCRLDDSVVGSVLIPITLSAELGDRTVETLNGDPISKVDVPD